MRQGLGLIRWGWRHHRAITATWALCASIAVITGLAQLTNTDVPGWVTWLFMLGVVGAVSCSVLLFRRQED